MKKEIKYAMSMIALLVSTYASLAQSVSMNQVKYMISRDSLTQVYTAWVIPNYDLPNENNPDKEEKGVTAQFSLKVPKGFVLTSLGDMKGIWEKSPTKIGSQAIFSNLELDANYEYYIIGKSNTETNYGVFKKNEPVALFNFTGRGGNASLVQVLENTDKAIPIVEQQLSLNLQSSFYSRSGQYSSVTSKPLEQFLQPTTLKKVLTENATAVNAVVEEATDYKFLAYPNPVKDTLNLKYFVEQANTEISIELIDAKGGVLKTIKQKPVSGYNTSRMPMNNVIDGAYFVRTYFDNKVQTVKVIKVQ
jgi:hypothetical protein